MSILTSPALRWPRRVAPELHFTGGATSNINCGAIHNAATKLWISTWFKLDSIHQNGSSVARIWGKFVDPDNRLYLSMEADGTLHFFKHDAGATFNIAEQSGRTQWSADTWYHVIASISSAAGARLIVGGGTVATDADVSAVVDGADFVIGSLSDGSATGLIGEMRDTALGTDDLSTTEERQLLAGIIPADATDFWRLNEGHGTSVVSLGSDATTGTVDSACTWETGLRQYVRW